MIARILGGCCAVGAAWLAFANTAVRTVYETAAFPNVPDAFDGFRVVLISDLHDRRLGDRFVSQLRGLHPDLIVAAGDLHAPDLSAKKETRYLALMEQLRAVAPVYVVEGNHDPEPRSEAYIALKAKLEAIGVVWLEQDTVPLYRDDQTIFLSGVGWSYAERFVPQAHPETFHLLVCHHPRFFDRYAELVDQVLAGHMHGGFIPLPRQNGVFAPGAGRSFLQRLRRDGFFPPYCRGAFEKNGSRLYVSTGLGCSGIPFRLIPGEVVVVDVKKKSQKS